MDTAIPPATGPDDGPLGQFVVPATVSLHEQRPRILKHGDTFAVFDHNGDAIGTPGSTDGLYHRDTRYLSHLLLSIDGLRPILLSSTLRDDNAMLTCDLTNPDLHDQTGGLSLGHDLIHIRRSRFLWNGGCFERLAIKNFDDQPRRIRFGLTFAADFADLFEVRGATRQHRGEQQAPVVGSDSVTLGYTGLDERLRQISLCFFPAPTELAGGHAMFEKTLAPGERGSIFIVIQCDPTTSALEPDRSFFIARRDSARALRRSSSRAAAVAASNEIFNEGIRRSISDLYMLVTDTAEGPYPYAGIPWFSTVFGRDGLITALETLWLDPAIARGVLHHLAANQATTFDPAADAEPGKILHEVRYGEMAELGEVPFRRYYGSIDSTPLFVMLAGAYLQRTGDFETIQRIWPNIEAALGWIDKEGDRDGDGFVEYGRRTSEGLVNQGWKDSHDSVFHIDGSLAKGPIAIVEVQAYVYGAWRAGAGIARQLGHVRRAIDLEAKAELLRKQFDEQFFDEELGTYVLALDGDKRPCRVRASNAGHALFTGIALPERAASVAAALMGGSSFCGWGIRTVPSTEARYNPMSYHNGSVWPHDNAVIGAGLARYGFRNHAARIFEGLFDASIYIDLRRQPELFCGFARQPGGGPTFYPVACSPQAWAAAAPLSLLQSCLGLSFDPDKAEVIFEQPILPAFLDQITLFGLSVARGTIDVRLTRGGSGVVVETLARRGTIRVVTMN
ncbi:MAG: amylo-alpha,6-glucosidase [Rhodospirillales bacterium]|nr:amylo-alpha,6-glucosidase [Rhodospirillales bacterium]